MCHAIVIDGVKHYSLGSIGRAVRRGLVFDPRWHALPTASHANHCICCVDAEETAAINGYVVSWDAGHTTATFEAPDDALGSEHDTPEDCPTWYDWCRCRPSLPGSRLNNKEGGTACQS